MSSNKRKYQENHRWKHRNPRRGGPGVLLTCETGREGKCRREGISILQHYFQHGLVGGDDDSNLKQTKNDDSPKDKNDASSESLSLEEELKVLRSKKSPTNFSPYDTGSRGSVFLMCTAEGCQMIPPIQVDSDEDDGDSSGKKGKESKQESKNDADKGERAAKKQKTESSVDRKKTETIVDNGDDAATVPRDDAKGATSNDGGKIGTNPWDPVPVVRKVFAGVEQRDTSAPASRFVTRMIPIQATCFASAAEIKATSEALLEKFFFPCPEYTSFAVAISKRICSNVKKPEIIDLIAGRILNSNDKYKVSLDNPDVTIVVEIARTLCGMAIVPRPQEMEKKFSLVNAREKAMPSHEEEEEDK